MTNAMDDGSRERIYAAISDAKHHIDDAFRYHRDASGMGAEHGIINDLDFALRKIDDLRSLVFDAKTFMQTRTMSVS